MEKNMKRAVVVGASSGIGREVALLLLKDGWTVGIAARREERLLEQKQEIMTSIRKKRHIRVIDWRYRLLTALWRRVPRWIWRNIRL